MSKIVLFTVLGTVMLTGVLTSDYKEVTFDTPQTQKTFSTENKTFTNEGDRIVVVIAPEDHLAFEKAKTCCCCAVEPDQMPWVKANYTFFSKYLDVKLLDGFFNGIYNMKGDGTQDANYYVDFTDARTNAVVKSYVMIE
ncbi:hypothetical protein [Flavobacterium sp. NRK1]|uniref:hypothetical protein n=1 Tax=Flavobacterium sp. NRK1 TaxID=2954929 RepID=UPI002092A01C|nr:hypothetical protein [Flavobacterium sp. NRK1]MCO6147421.1 hypothetical protein [Flavobacterium sp. NRK1]